MLLTQKNPGELKIIQCLYKHNMFVQQTLSIMFCLVNFHPCGMRIKQDRVNFVKQGKDLKL